MKRSLLGCLAVWLMATSARADSPTFFDPLMFNGGQGDPSVNFDPSSGLLQPGFLGGGFATSSISEIDGSLPSPNSFPSDGFSFTIPNVIASDHAGGFYYGSGGSLSVVDSLSNTLQYAYTSEFTSGRVRLVAGTSGGFASYEATFFTASAAPDAELANFFQLGNHKLTTVLDFTFSTIGSSNSRDYLDGGGVTFHLASVPEPTSLILMATGLGLTGWRLRRRRAE